MRKSTARALVSAIAGLLALTIVLVSSTRLSASTHTGGQASQSLAPAAANDNNGNDNGSNDNSGNGNDNSGNDNGNGNDNLATPPPAVPPARWYGYAQDPDEFLVGAQPNDPDTLHAATSPGGGTVDFRDGLISVAASGGGTLGVDIDPADRARDPAPALPFDLRGLRCYNLRLTSQAAPAGSVTLVVRFTDQDIAFAGNPASLSLQYYSVARGRYVQLPAELDQAAHTLTWSNLDISAFYKYSRIWLVTSVAPPSVIVQQGAIPPPVTPQPEQEATPTPETLTPTETATPTATATHTATRTPISGAQSDDLNCADFTSQQDAQAVLDADRGDPYSLDGNHDGTACEDYLYPTA